MPGTRRQAKKRRRTGGQGSQTPTGSVPAAERLSHPGHAGELLSGLERLWRAGTLCDLVIKSPASASQDECEVKVHSVVAAALSEPLEKMLVGEMASVKDGVLSVGPEVEGPALRSLSEFMYTGELELTAATTWSVLSAANYFGMDAAKQLVAECIAGGLSPENALGMLKAAGCYACPPLGEEATAFVERHFAAVAEEEEWLEQTAEEVKGWLSRDTLCVPSEMTVYASLVRWTERAPRSARRRSRSCSRTRRRCGCLGFPLLRLRPSRPRRGRRTRF